nr:ORF1 [Torque teno felis virus]
MYYRRPRWRWRRRWRKRPRRQNRRFWKTRRYTRRSTVRRRRRRGRKKRPVMQWGPSATRMCTITGWTFGLVTDATSQIPNRMISVNLSGNPKARRMQFTGGGTNLSVFSLAFLWDEHKMFHNWWSQSNDGFDLARYFGTTIYLPPHKDQTYIFWWDTDFNRVSMVDYWKTQPSLMLAWKNKRIIRPVKDGNHRTKKVRIKPPATVSNQWRYAGSWMTMGLFMWGVILIDFNKPFSIWQHTTWNQVGVVKFSGIKYTSMTSSGVQATIYYAHWIDSGLGNYVLYKTESGPSDLRPDPLTGYKRVDEANDIPYWITNWGHNKNYNWDDPTDLTQTGTSFMVFYWYDLQEGDILNGLWQTKPKAIFKTNASGMYTLGYCGPFVQRQNQTPVNIPILYKSRWQWGGATFNKQAVSNYVNFVPHQVPVRNPAFIEKSVITPWDCDGHGILTDKALQRFLRPSNEVDVRRTLPYETEPPEDEYLTSSAEEVSETSEDEAGEKDQQNLDKILTGLRRRIHREQHERHRLHKFFRGLINSKPE